MSGIESDCLKPRLHIVRQNFPLADQLLLAYRNGLLGFDSLFDVSHAVVAVDDKLEPLLVGPENRDREVWRAERQKYWTIATRAREGEIRNRLGIFELTVKARRHGIVKESLLCRRNLCPELDLLLYSANGVSWERPQDFSGGTGKVHRNFKDIFNIEVW
jgi:hypothetical protein